MKTLLTARLPVTVSSVQTWFYTVEPVLATTWKLRTHNFSPFNSWIQMYGQRSWKCDHLINANCGHQRSAQSVDSTWEKRPHTSNRAKRTFCLSNFSFVGTPNERLSRLQAPLVMVVANYAPAYTWEPPIADVVAPAGACVQLHIEKFWIKPGKWDHLKYRTTYSQSWS